MYKLTPASENPWYQLATLAGDDHSANVLFWNGYQRKLLERANIFDSTDEDMSKLPELGESDLERVQQIEGLPSQMDGDSINDFLRNKLPRIDFSNFYFGFKTVFVGSTFDFLADFTGATFGADVYFIGAKFDLMADFSHSRFRKSAAFSVIKDAMDAAPMSFLGAKFCSNAPIFYGRRMHENTDWTDAVWPKTSDSEDQLKSDIRAYERLRLIARDLGKVNDEHFFFRKEMDCARVLVRFQKKGLRRFVSVTPFWLFRAFSNYGHSFERPAFGLLCLWSLGSLGNFLHFNKSRPLSDIAESNHALDSMILSLANMLPFFGFHSRLPTHLLKVKSDWIFLLSSGQTILGFILLFFLGLGLRNRFRLK
ncbi:pentapeptide repeat-containing protein [SAR116 cluster bacterium]|nr:pentapeptide repeat-containing protein [SAR116 cluster bacterium]